MYDHKLAILTRELHDGKWKAVCSSYAPHCTPHATQSGVHNSATKQTSCPRACRILLALRQWAPLLFCILVLSETGERKALRAFLEKERLSASPCPQRLSHRRHSRRPVGEPVIEKQEAGPLRRYRYWIVHRLSLIHI